VASLRARSFCRCQSPPTILSNGLCPRGQLAAILAELNHELPTRISATGSPCSRSTPLYNAVKIKIGRDQLPSGLITNRPARPLAGPFVFTPPHRPFIITGGAAPVRSPQHPACPSFHRRPAPVLAQGHGPRAALSGSGLFFGLRCEISSIPIALVTNGHDSSRVAATNIAFRHGRAHVVHAR